MNSFSKEEIYENMELLKLLSNNFKNIAKATTELMNLKAIMNLPKGTEHFISDIHGEYLAFDYLMRNGSGVVYRKIEDTFGKSLSEEEKKILATLVCYPKLLIEKLQSEGRNMKEFYEINIRRLIKICTVASSKYSRSKVNRALPKDFAYIINELIYQDDGFNLNRKAYYEQIIESIIDLDLADELIEELCLLIQRFTIDHLHILGDIYDRGSGPHYVMDRLMQHHSLDIQWGNHDILWMGAAAGCKACIACVVRICLRYANTSILEDCYGINLLPLASLAMSYYADDKSEQFMPKVTTEIPDIDEELMAKMHKAISIIQFKLEGQLIKRNAEYNMDDRALLDKICYDDFTIKVGEEIYKLNDTNFPTINKDNAYELNDDEQRVIELLHKAFTGSEKLQTHIRFLYSKGGMYQIYNDNLLFHACIPMTEDGKFREVELDGKAYKGKELLDKMDQKARAAYFNSDEYSSDFLWYLWCHKDSPLFGKDKMTTFERYFIDDKSTHKEKSDPYFRCTNDYDTALYILKEFDLADKENHIINGHIPVKVKSGVSPIKAEGKVLQIDGGFSRAYQPTTGIAGFTLIYNSYGLKLVSHEPFDSVEKVIAEGVINQSTTNLVEEVQKRKTVADTDTGKQFSIKIRHLEMLVFAYKNGYLKEKY